MNKHPLCYITHVSVLDTYKRQGIATQMLYLLEKYALCNNYYFLKLEVHKNNTHAIQTYTKVGFSISNDCSSNSYYMEKTLDYVPNL